MVKIEVITDVKLEENNLLLKPGKYYKRSKMKATMAEKIIKISYIPFDELVNNFKNNFGEGQSNSFNQKDLSRGLFPEIKLIRQLSITNDLNNLLISVS